MDEVNHMDELSFAMDVLKSERMSLQDEKMHIYSRLSWVDSRISALNIALEWLRNAEKERNSTIYRVAQQNTEGENGR